MARIIVFLGRDSGALVAAGALHLSQHVGHRSRFWPELVAGLPLHPSQHGAQADELVALGAPDSPVVAITHSDVFVMRLRRRIAEGKLRPEDVALVWVDGAKTTPMPLDGTGSSAWWPKGVGGEAQAELRAAGEAVVAKLRRGVERPARTLFYVLSLSHTPQDGPLAWWGPDERGYVTQLAEGGRYTDRQIEREVLRMNNGRTTFAVPCSVVDALAENGLVPTSKLPALRAARLPPETAEVVVEAAPC